MDMPDVEEAVERRRRRAILLRERAEARALLERVAPRRSRNAKARQRYLMSTYSR